MTKTPKFSKIYKIVFFVLLFNFLYWQTTSAFSLFDFINQIKTKLLSPQQESVIKEFETKRKTLKEVLSLINQSYQEEFSILSSSCPLKINYSSSSTQDQNQIIFQLITLLNQTTTSSSSLETSPSSTIFLQEESLEEDSASPSLNENLNITPEEALIYFSSLPLEEKTKILFWEKICENQLFLQKELNWYHQFNKKLKEVKNLKELEDLISILKEHRQGIQDKLKESSEVVSLIKALQNARTAQQREREIKKAIKSITLDNTSSAIISKLLSLAEAKINLAKLKIEKAKLIFLINQHFLELEQTSSSTSSPSKSVSPSPTLVSSTPTSTNRLEKLPISSLETFTSSTSETSTSSTEIEKIKKIISVELKLEKNNIFQIPVLLEESQNYIQSAYQDFALISKIVNQ